LPLNSAQIATEPLPPEVWDQIGWDGHEILGDFANAYCYCQRTREGRITVGARGVPYLYGSNLDTNGAPDPETIRRLTAILHKHFPAAARLIRSTMPGAASWACRATGARPWGWTRHGPWLGGGLCRRGVSTSNLAGRTLADLALGRDTDLTGCPGSTAASGMGA
jgi:glycine/D-amino acid oxidase-like deaminating enzyme